jgi:hypothetical protein
VAHTLAPFFPNSLRASSASLASAILTCVATTASDQPSPPTSCVHAASSPPFEARGRSSTATACHSVATQDTRRRWPLHYCRDARRSLLADKTPRMLTITAACHLPHMSYLGVKSSHHVHVDRLCHCHLACHRRHVSIAVEHPCHIARTTAWGQAPTPCCPIRACIAFGYKCRCRCTDRACSSLRPDHIHPVAPFCPCAPPIRRARVPLVCHLADPNFPR